jgi:ATP-dependent helicase HrpB
MHTLPIDLLIPVLLRSFSESSNAVIVAPPGAGKTTRVAPAIVEAGLLAPKNPAVVMLQPRRVAARAAAARIAEERGWKLGGEVGYQIRFEKRIGPKTRLRVVTEGILTRQMQADPFLEGVGCVILDEFHERSIHTDLALAMLREIQRTVREDLRIVVMSATMNPGPVAKFLGGAPIFESEGRLFPIEIEYLDRPRGALDSPVWETCAAAIGRAIANPEAGDVLVFLPGIGEIRRTEELVRDIARKGEAEIHVLHSSISGDEQDRALRPSARRKVILATNIAETSLTIEGVRTVIDSGLVRVLVNDARVGIDRLELRRVSRASATQRAGRAGRTAPGRCILLWTRAEDATLEDHETAEIARIDLSPTLLALHAFGVRDPSSFGWFEPPRAERIAQAERLLMMLGALDSKGALTALGKKLSGLPVHPRLGCLLLAGAEAGVLDEAATLAAMLSEGGLLFQPRSLRQKEAKWEGASDMLDRLESISSGSDSEELALPSLQAIRRVKAELVRSWTGFKVSARRP